MHHHRYSNSFEDGGDQQQARDNIPGSQSPDTSHLHAGATGGAAAIGGAAAASNMVMALSNMHTSASASSLASDGSSGANHGIGGAYLRPSSNSLQDQGIWAC